MEAAGEPTGWATVCEANRLGLLKKGWGTMTAIARKVQIGTAACAIAAAAALTPAAVAQADPAAPAPLVSQGSLGGSAGAGAALISPDCVTVGGPDCTNAPSTLAVRALVSGTIFKSSFSSVHPTRIRHRVSLSSNCRFCPTPVRSHTSISGLRLWRHCAARALRHRIRLSGQRLPLLSSDVTRQLVRRPELVLSRLLPRSADLSRARETH